MVRSRVQVLGGSVPQFPQLSLCPFPLAWEWPPLEGISNDCVL